CDRVAGRPACAGTTCPSCPALRLLTRHSAVADGETDEVAMDTGDALGQRSEDEGVGVGPAVKRILTGTAAKLVGTDAADHPTLEEKYRSKGGNRIGTSDPPHRSCDTLPPHGEVLGRAPAFVIRLQAS